MFSIKGKLFILIGTILLLTALSFILILVFVHQLYENHELVRHSQLVMVHMLEARRSEKDFFARSDKKYVASNDENVKSIKKSIHDVISHEADIDHVRRLQELLNFVDQYASLFHEVVDLKERKGLDQNSGIRGELRSAIHTVEDSIIKQKKDTLLVSLLMCRRHEKDYIIRGDDKYIEKFNNEITNLRRLVHIHIKNRVEMLEYINLYKEKFTELYKINLEIKDKENKFRENIHKIEPVIHEYEKEVDIAAENNFKYIQYLIILAFSVLIIISLLIGIKLTFSIYNALNGISLILRRSNKRINSASANLADSSQVLSRASQEIAHGANEQASSIEETSASLEEFSAMIKQNSLNVQEAYSISKKTSEISEMGNTNMLDMIEAMKGINDSSDEIKKIIKVIDDIAFQTNILALNASVEAAKAGEVGMGFAVVAEEVKSLANHSLDSAKQTSVLIERSGKNIQAGYETLNKLSDIFKDILLGIKKVAEMNKEVELNSNEQLKGVEQTNRAIVELDKVIQMNASTAEETASSAEETASSAEELQRQVNQLNSVIRNLLQLIHGNNKKKKRSRRKKRVDFHNTNGTSKSDKKELSKPKEISSDSNKKRSPEEIIPFENDEDFDNDEI